MIKDRECKNSWISSSRLPAPGKSYHHHPRNNGRHFYRRPRLQGSSIAVERDQRLRHARHSRSNHACMIFLMRTDALIDLHHRRYDHARTVRSRPARSAESGGLLKSTMARRHRRIRTRRKFSSSMSALSSPRIPPVITSNAQKRIGQAQRRISQFGYKPPRKGRLFSGTTSRHLAGHSQ